MVQLFRFSFDGITYESVSKQCHDVTKWFKLAGKLHEKCLGEIMLTFSKSETSLEVWHVNRQCQIEFIFEIRRNRRHIQCLKGIGLQTFIYT